MMTRNPRPADHRSVCIAAPMTAIVLWFGGCSPTVPLPRFPGLYDVTRGTALLSIKWVVGQAEGQLTQESHDGEIVPIDPNDVPELLRPLAQKWNEGVDEFNAGLDEMFPNQVLVSHPQPWMVKVESPEDPNEFFQGVNGADGFLALAFGGTPGDPNTGAVPAIGTGSITGEWDGHDTVTGEWKVTAKFGGAGPQGGGLLLTVAVTVPYEAVLAPQE
ncbi:MAG: hypothetical protein JXQ73_25085 [Phycisphaerae bacterium]|nr:hypothetical protein [Phycisphaerae bacterium]